MAQYGQRNNVVLSGIPELVSEDVLEKSVISVLADDVFVESQDIKACHRFGKPDVILRKQLCVLWTKNKKVLCNKKKLSSIDCSRHNFTQNTKNFGNENLTPMNESIAHNCRMLKHSGLIHGCFSREGIVRIKRLEKNRFMKISHMDKLCGLFPDFDLGDAHGKGDIFLDASQLVNDSVKSSY